MLTDENLMAPETLGESSIILLWCSFVKNYSELISPSHLSPCPEMLDRVSRKDTELENYSLTFIFEPWEHAQPHWKILPEAGPFSLPSKRLCWGRPVAFFHIPHSAPCPLPRHIPLGETSPHPSPAPLPNPCNYQTPTHKMIILGQSLFWTILDKTPKLATWCLFLTDLSSCKESGEMTSKDPT